MQLQADTRDILASPLKKNRALTEAHAKFITAQNESLWHELAEQIGFSMDRVKVPTQTHSAHKVL